MAMEIPSFGRRDDPTTEGRAQHMAINDLGTWQDTEKEAGMYEWPPP